MKIAISTSSFARYSEEPLELLRQRGIIYELNSTGRKLEEEESMELLRDCVGLAAGTEKLSRRVLDACPALRVISRCGTGLDTVDLVAAREKGIAVRNTPDGPTLAVAELTLGFALDLLRETNRMDRALRAGSWQKRMGFLLEGKRVGLVGFGRIGRVCAKLFAAFGAQVAFSDPVAVDSSHEKMALEELCAWADILSLHCPRPKDGQPLLDARLLRSMKPGSWLINAARGGLVDEEALFAVLSSGHLAGAALDTFMQEPYAGPLLGLDNVILTPHIGSYAREARIRMEVDTIKNLLEALQAGAAHGA